MSTPHASVESAALESQSATISFPTRSQWREANPGLLAQIKNDGAVILLPQVMREVSR